MHPRRYHSNIYAIPLSRAAVFGAAVAFAAQNLLRATPPRGFPSQFAWDVIAIMEPMTLLGTAIGVRLNKMSPQWAIVILLVAVLGSAAWETWKKAVAKNVEEDERDALLHRASIAGSVTVVSGSRPLNISEATKLFLTDAALSATSATSPTAAIVGSGQLPPFRDSASSAASPSHSDDEASEDHSLLHDSRATLSLSTPAARPQFDASDDTAAAADDEDDLIASLAGGRDVAMNIPKPPSATTVPSIASSSSSSSPSSSQLSTDDSLADAATREQLLQPISFARCALSVGVCWLTVLVLNFELGGSGKITRSGIECGSLEWALLWCIAVPVVAGFTWWNAAHLNRVERLREEHGVVLPREQIKWTTRNLAFYSAACFGAGVVGALAGVGGSTIKQPLLLQFGLEPTIAQASSQLMLLSTVSSVMIQYAALKMLPLGYAVVFLLLGLLSGYTGKSIMDFYVKKLNRTAIIVYALAIYTLVAALSLSAIGIYDVVRDWNQGRFERFWFRALCAALPGRGGN